MTVGHYGNFDSNKGGSDCHQEYESQYGLFLSKLENKLERYFKLALQRLVNK